MAFPYLLIFTKVASTEGFVIACALLLGIVYVHCGMRRAIAFLSCAAGVVVSVAALKDILQIARPEGALIETLGYAFPSGHAAGAAFVALSVCHLVRHHSPFIRYAIYFASLCAALAIGVSRVTFLVHTPLQVTAGFAIGLVWAVVYILVERSETKE